MIKVHINPAIITQGVSGGVFRGVGKQKVGAMSNLIGHYFIGFPIGVSLLFKTPLGVVGKKKTLSWTHMFCNHHNETRLSLVASVVS